MWKYGNVECENAFRAARCKVISTFPHPKIIAMKFIVSLLLIMLLSFVASLYMDWWCIALVAFIVAACIHQKPGKAFLTGFIALFLLWGVMAWWIDSKNEHVLSQKVAMLIGLGSSSFLLVLVTALIGAVVAGLGALSGSYLRRVQRR